ncbi:MAG: hypothetical protein V4754_20990 [Pseudomonadota bacterium]
MTYEEYLDEVTTLMTEKYNLKDAEAVKLVMRAQSADFFVPHDNNEALRDLNRAHKDAKTLYDAAQRK